MDEIATRFQVAWAGTGEDAPSEPELLPVRLVHACLRVLPAAAAGLSVIRDGFRVPLAATDASARLAERLQFTVFEGPCLTAVNEHRTVAASRGQIEARWPLYAHELFSRTPYQAVIALPFSLGDETHGALDLYQTEPARVAALRVTDTSVITDEITRALLMAQSLNGPSSGLNWSEDVPSWLRTESVTQRMLLWVAIGIVMSCFFDLTEADALALLRSHAYAEGITLDDLASELTDGTRSPTDMRP